MIKAIKWTAVFCFLFVTATLLFFQPIAWILEWLPICPKNPQTMAEKECGYIFLWLWPLTTLVVSGAIALWICVLLARDGAGTISEHGT